MARPKKQQTPSDRIRRIIDQIEDGNVSAVARRLQYSQTGTNKIYRGDTAWPSSQFIQKFCTEYGVDPTFILLGVTSEVWAESEPRIRRAASGMAAHFAAQLLERTAEDYLELEGTAKTRKASKKGTKIKL